MKNTRKYVQTSPEESKVLFDKFNQDMIHLGYKLVTADTKIKILFKLDPPDRATEDNVLQCQYYYISKSGYMSIILVGIKSDGTFAKSGAGWSHIFDENGRKRMSMLFNRTEMEGFLKRMLSFAILFKNIADSRKPGFELVEITDDSEREGHFEWRSEMTSELFNHSNYFHGMATEQSQLVNDRIIRSLRWLQKSQGKVSYRRREKRSTWKERRVAKV